MVKLTRFVVDRAKTKWASFGYQAEFTDIKGPKDLEEIKNRVIKINDEVITPIIKDLSKKLRIKKEYVKKRKKEKNKEGGKK